MSEYVARRFLRLQTGFIASDGFFKSQVECVAYQRVSNRHLAEPGDAFAEEREVVQRKVVAGIYAEPEPACGIGAAI